MNSLPGLSWCLGHEGTNKCLLKDPHNEYETLHWIVDDGCLDGPGIAGTKNVLGFTRGLSLPLCMG